MRWTFRLRSMMIANLAISLLLAAWYYGLFWFQASAGRVTIKLELEIALIQSRITYCQLHAAPGHHCQGCPYVKGSMAHTIREYQEALPIVQRRYRWYSWIAGPSVRYLSYND